ncbi:alpha/beta hydrolase [Deltaproteobacteria bacterium]|nr:alpha/beta hydrolase [Deltaproteobacteria bacterium]
MKKLLATGFLILMLTLITGNTYAQTDNNERPRGGPPGGDPPDADTSKITQKWLDISYADKSETQKLDVYLPNEGEGPFPVIVFVHGGGFRSGDKADWQLGPILPALDKGYAIVSTNYRLSGEALFPAPINDLKAAVRWIRANAESHGLNPEKIAAWGGSAGGHLVSLLGTSGDIRELEDLSLGNPKESSRVQAVVDWFGPIDFLKLDEQHEKNGLGPGNHNKENSQESALLGKAITSVPELVKSANPETYITSDDPPFLIQHGTKDALVPVQQSINLAASLGKVIGEKKVSLILLDGAGHGDDMFFTQENIDKVLSFLDKYLK